MQVTIGNSSMGFPGSYNVGTVPYVWPYFAGIFTYIGLIYIYIGFINMESVPPINRILELPLESYKQLLGKYR